jgi:hypothetical protein
MFRFNYHNQGAYYLSMIKLQLLKESQRCILTDYFNHYCFRKLK